MSDSQSGVRWYYLANEWTNNIAAVTALEVDGQTYTAEAIVDILRQSRQPDSDLATARQRIAELETKNKAAKAWATRWKHGMRFERQTAEGGWAGTVAGVEAALMMTRQDLVALKKAVECEIEELRKDYEVAYANGEIKKRKAVAKRMKVLRKVVGIDHLDTSARDVTGADEEVTHSGAALLAELEAARAVVDAAREAKKHQPLRKVLRDALSAYDAARGRASAEREGK